MLLRDNDQKDAIIKQQNDIFDNYVTFTSRDDLSTEVFRQNTNVSCPINKIKRS